MCHVVCFEAGRPTQTQSSWTALCCSRKWMSGHADALAQFVTDPSRQIRASVTPSTVSSQENLPMSTGRGLFPLDKSLSWMSHSCPIDLFLWGVSLSFSAGCRLKHRKRFERRSPKVKCESRTDGLFPADGLRSPRRVSDLCRALSGGSVLAPLLLLGSVALYGVRSTDSS